MNQAREINSLAKTKVNHIITPSLTSPEKTFASLFYARPKTHTHRKKSPIIEEFLKLANYFLEPEELLLEREINNFICEYKNLPKSEAKVEFLRLFNKVKSTYGP